MKTIVKILSDYGKFMYEVTLSSIPKKNEKSRHVIYYGTMMEIKN
ncbi:hypothetical protein [Bacillus sp. T3]|nr:hypothetical protein [Bacillus sp. T3]